MMVSSSNSLFIISVFIIILNFAPVNNASISGTISGTTINSEESHKSAFLNELKLLGSSFFSYHRCVGWDYTETAWKKRTCHLKNVCYIRETAQWYYLNRHGSAVRQNDLSVSLSPLGRTMDGGSSGKRLTFHVTSATHAATAEYAQLPQRQGVHIIYESYNAENFGHFVGDELLPLYRAADLFGYAQELNNIQVVRWMDGSPYNKACTTVDERRRCDRLYNALFPLLSRRPLQLMTADNESFCVSDLIVGIGMLSDHCDDRTGHGRLQNEEAHCNYGSAQQFWRFREHLVNNSRSRARTKRGALRATRRNITTATIVVSTRRMGDKVYRLPSNYEQAMRSVALILNQSIIFVDIATLPIGEQIKLVSQAQLLTSAAGGASFIGLFLPKGASMILFSDETHDRQLDFGFFAALSHIDVTYVLSKRRQPVSLKEMLYLADRMLTSANMSANNRLVGERRSLDGPIKYGQPANYSHHANYGHPANYSRPSNYSRLVRTLSHRHLQKI